MWYRKFLAVILAAIMLSQSACAPLPEVVSARSSPSWTENFVQDREDTLRMITTATVAQMNEAYTTHYSPQFPNSKLAINEHVSNGQVEIIFNWQSETGYFPPGQYRIQSIKDGADRQSAAFLELIVSGLNMASEQLRQARIEHELIVTYSAQADATSTGNLTYKGEFGVVELPEAITTVNNTPTLIRVLPGQRIDNPKLAALRAYSMRQFVHSVRDPNMEVNDLFDLTASDARGPQYRSVRIAIRLAPKAETKPWRPIG